MGDEDSAEKLQSWIDKNKNQEERLKELSPKERAAWGFTKKTAKEQAKADEKIHPSKKIKQ